MACWRTWYTKLLSILLLLHLIARWSHLRLRLLLCLALLLLLIHLQYRRLLLLLLLRCLCLPVLLLLLLLLLKYLELSLRVGNGERQTLSTVSDTLATLLLSGSNSCHLIAQLLLLRRGGSCC